MEPTFSSVDIQQQPDQQEPRQDPVAVSFKFVVDEDEDGGNNGLNDPAILPSTVEARSTTLGDDDSPLLRDDLRRARKMSEFMARLSLVSAEEQREGFLLENYPVREWKIDIPGLPKPVAINPVVSLIAVILLWSMVIWCSVDRTPALETIREWKSYISLAFTWFFQGSKAVFLFFVGYLWYKYGHLHLGDDDDTPEFSTLAYASMILTAGAGNGLLVYSVFEPLLNRKYHYYANAGYRSQDEIDMFAINMTVVGWGLAGWAPYAVVAVAMSLAVYRFKLPMAFRSCFYPIFRHYTWGWIGDLIDGFTIVFTLAGIFTSLGLVPINFTAGLANMGWIDEATTGQQIKAIENTSIWVVTVLSLVTVVAGLRIGIRYMSLLALAMACLLMVFVFIHDDSKFLLNLQVQTVGYYLQTSLFQLNFWTDAFGQLREGSGRAVDGNAAEQDWMESSLNYIMAWWIVAAPLNGQFICSISRGRKVWEVIVYSVIVPAGFCLFWFCVWGGIGLRQSRQAMELKLLGETRYNNSAHFSVNGTEFCFEVPQDTVKLGDETVFTNYLPGVSPVCDFDEEVSSSAVYNVLNSFSLGLGSFLGPMLSFFFMLACVLFHLTGAATAALFVDKLTSSGRKTGMVARRVFWTTTVGALASVLFTTGGGDSHSNVRAAMILCGLPCGLLLCYVMQPVLLLCAAADEQTGLDNELDVADYQFPVQPEFLMPIYGGIFNAFEYLTSLGRVNNIRKELGIHRPTRFQVIECAKGLLVPFVSLHQVLVATYPQSKKSNMAVTVLFAACHLGWFGTWVASFIHPEINGCAWMLLLVKGFVLAMVRSDFRTHYNLRSNGVGDVVSSTFFWPQVLAQMRVQCVLVESKDR